MDVFATYVVVACFQVCCPQGFLMRYEKGREDEVGGIYADLIGVMTCD